MFLNPASKMPITAAEITTANSGMLVGGTGLEPVTSWV